MTGLPCPGCGLTRAFCAISHGNFSLAWHANGYAYPLYVAVVAVALWPVTVGRWVSRPWQNRRFARVVTAVLIAGAAFMLMFGLLRIYLHVTAA